MAKAKKNNKNGQTLWQKNIDDLHVPEIGFYNLAEKMTDEQREFAESIIHDNITFCNAKAGTGKTTIAVATAKYLYEHHLIDKLIYIASPCQQATLGHLPGELEQKIANYMTPLYDALVKIGEFPMQAMNETEGWVEGIVDTFLRGTNIENSVVIIDEAQNYDKSQLKKILTRMHDSCHVIVIGHSEQCDLRKPETSGFIPMMNLFEELKEKYELNVGFIKLTVNFRGKISQLADELQL